MSITIRMEDKQYKDNHIALPCKTMKHASRGLQLTTSSSSQKETNIFSSVTESNSGAEEQTAAHLHVCMSNI